MKSTTFRLNLTIGAHRLQILIFPFLPLSVNSNSTKFHTFILHILSATQKPETNLQKNRLSKNAFFLIFLLIFSREIFVILLGFRWKSGDFSARSCWILGSETRFGNGIRFCWDVWNTRTWFSFQWRSTWSQFFGHFNIFCLKGTVNRGVFTHVG